MKFPLLVYVLGPLILALLMYIKRSSFTKPLTLIIQVFFFLGLFSLSGHLNAYGVYEELVGIEVLPVGMSLRVDSLSYTLLLLNNGLFMLLYAFSYKEHFSNPLFGFLFFSLQGIINGIFLSNDFFNFYLLIEVATIIASVLIMYKKDSRSMYDGMLYLMVNMTAMAFFLFGIGFLYKYFGVLDFQHVALSIQEVGDHKALILPFAFLLTGVSLKAAIMPLFSWLPKAHGTASAPAIISAILSGIFVKTGIYGFIRVTEIFRPAFSIQEFFYYMGIFTALAGVVFALTQTDIKLLLSYSTISQVGVLMMGFNSPSTYGEVGGMLHILSHGIFKSSLFILAGVLVKHYKTRDLEKMSGLWYESKLLSFVLLVCFFSITGAPFFAGGASKGIIVYEKAPWIFQVITLGSMLYMMKLLLILIGKKSKEKVSLLFHQKLVFLTMMGATMYLGTNYVKVLDFLGYPHVSLSFQKIVDKSLTYLILLFLVLLLYYFGRSYFTRFALIRELELGFNTIALAIFGFFTTIMSYLYFFA